MRHKSRLLLFSVLLFCLLFVVYAVSAWTGVPVAQDPLVRMPGTQPGQASLEAPNRCLNCHAGYNTATEPGFNWMGSMMAQSARDFLFWSCMVVAAQDSIWAVGTPNATDICERCHFPKGWLEGRSDPTNASLMSGADYDGVQCDFCHQLYDPFFAETYSGAREGSDWLNYWDETGASGTPSQAAADATFLEDQSLAKNIVMFNGSPFFINDLPPVDYTENGSGQFFVSPNSQKRASFADAAARHQMLYSRYHKSKYFCSTCHDVSNPVLANLADDPAQPLTTESYSAYSYLHVERTFSEFMLSAYGQDGGASGIGPFAPDTFDTSNPNNNIAMCQDCHMRDVLGRAADKNGVPLRPDESIEHPQSGQPLHDMTGGNVWVSTVLASAIPGSPNHDPVNEGLLNKGPGLLTLDLTQGQGIDPLALLAGADRARQQLLLAASIEGLSYDPSTGDLSFRVQNQTGHKLISGFPEGRRMFLNIKVYSAGNLVYEINPYDPDAGTLKGLSYYTYNLMPPPDPLSSNEIYSGTLVYEMHPSSSLTGEQETFHFALADGRYKDNRIPPVGFNIGGAQERLVVPVMDGVEDTEYYSAQEYAGGYDQVDLVVPAGADLVEVSLYYQTTSREYIEFLSNEIQGLETTLSSPTPSGESQAYIVQSDPFFSQLREWGTTIWQLWEHNMNIDGAAPFLMAQASTGGAQTCSAPIPELLAADPGQKQVSLSWSDPHSGDPDVIGYLLYYDQAGKAQLITQLGLQTTFADSNLVNGQLYCYKVTSNYSDCESGFSNIMCASPTGQFLAGVGEGDIESGYYSGKGQNQTFNPSTVFVQGDTVIVRVRVTDESGSPVSGASVEITITGPETLVLTSSSSGSDGLAEASWSTRAPKRNQGGTNPGVYTATISGLSSNTYSWDGVSAAIQFTLDPLP